MKLTITILLVFFCLVHFNGCGIIAKKYTKSETVEFNLNSANKRKLKLENINGNINIIQNSDSNVFTIKAYKEIKVKKKNLYTPFDEIKIVIDSASDMILIKTVFSKKGFDSFINWGKSQKVDFNIYIPLNSNVEINNINGDITSEKICANLKIDNVNGNVDIKSFEGKIKCEIVNGTFTGEINSTSGADVNTVNGSITLKLNGLINANIFAKTLNGKISDEELILKDVLREKKQLKGKVGNINSDTDIRLETVNGKIKLLGIKEI